MGRIKNIKISKLFSLGLISCLLFTSNVVKADNLILTTGTVIENVTLNNVNDINNTDNIGKSLSVKGNITTIDGSYITIKDDSGEAKIYLDGITIEDLTVNEYVFASGIVTLQDSSTVIVVNDINNIGIVSDEELENPDTDETPDDSEDTEEPDDQENPDSSEDTEDLEDEDNSDGSEDIETPDNSQNQENPNGSENAGQQGENNSNANNSGNNNNVSSSGNTNGNSITSGNNNAGSTSNNGSVVNSTSSKVTIKGKTPTTVSYDLSSSQWASIKSAYEDGDIKLQDLPNNQIRIVKISEGYGDTVWIVNDPRNLDEEVDSVFTVGVKLLEQIDYTQYDVTESTWQSICEDVKDGDAKIKFTDDNGIKVIYNNDGKDSTTVINKK